jgi:hypothetical protein
MTRNPTRAQEPLAARQVRNTAEPSGELSVGDIVCVGEVALAVGRPAGWEPASGPLAEVRTREHGTSPLPLPGRSPDSGPAPDPRKENHGGFPDRAGVPARAP